MTTVPAYRKRNILADVIILSVAFVGVIILSIGIMLINFVNHEQLDRNKR